VIFDRKNDRYLVFIMGWEGYRYGLGRLSPRPFQVTKINIMPTFAANPADEVLPQVSSGASGEKDWPMVQIIL
jgi:hypothetical protein